MTSFIAPKSHRKCERIRILFCSISFFFARWKHRLSIFINGLCIIKNCRQERLPSFCGSPAPSADEKVLLPLLESKLKKKFFGRKFKFASPTLLILFVLQYNMNKYKYSGTMFPLIYIFFASDSKRACACKRCNLSDENPSV